MHWISAILGWLVLLPMWRRIFRPAFLHWTFAGGTALIWLIVIIAIAASAGSSSDDGNDGSVRTDPTATRSELPADTPEPEATAAPSEAAAPTEAPEPTEVDNEAPLAAGAVAKAKWVRITINEIIDPYSSGNQFDLPAAGNRFVVFDMTVENISDDSHFFSIFDFALKDTENFQYEVGFSPIVEPSLSSVTDLQGGGSKVQGRLGFEVREGAALFEMKFDPELFSEEDIVFRVGEQ